jgi:hypothetical protein
MVIQPKVHLPLTLKCGTGEHGLTLHVLLVFLNI